MLSLEYDAKEFEAGMWVKTETMKNFQKENDL